MQEHRLGRHRASSSAKASSYCPNSPRRFGSQAGIRSRSLRRPSCRRGGQHGPSSHVADTIPRSSGRIHPGRGIDRISSSCPRRSRSSKPHGRRNTPSQRIRRPAGIPSLSEGEMSQSSQRGCNANRPLSASRRTGLRFVGAGSNHLHTRRSGGRVATDLSASVGAFS